MIKLAALCTAIATMVLVATAAYAAVGTARVGVMQTSPFTVRGTGFRAHERVAVTVYAKTTRMKAVTAGVRGGFTTAFSGVTIGRCDGYVIRAKGNRGSIAFLKVRPECPQPGPSGSDVLFPVASSAHA